MACMMKVSMYFGPMGFLSALFLDQPYRCIALEILEIVEVKLFDYMFMGGCVVILL